MDEAPIAAASAKRLRPAIVVAVGLMLLWLVAYWNLSPLSWDLVQLSRQGPRALALYVTGHYRELATNREVTYVEEKGSACDRHEHRRHHTLASARFGMTGVTAKAS